MSAELEAHLEGLVARHIAAGMSPEEARHAALRSFGGVEQIKERCRDERRSLGLEEFGRDLAFGLRALRRAPGFTAVAVLSLALGIGAATAVFSVANAILLRSLPVPHPEQLRVLHWSGTSLHIPSWVGGDTSFTPPHFFRLREQAAGQAELFGFVPLSNLVAQVQGNSFRAQGVMVSDNFFAGLGISAYLGRTLAPGEDYAGAGGNVVVSYALWEKQLDANPEAVGQTITVNGTAYTLVGVLPRGFTGVQGGESAEIFVPLAAKSPFLYREITSNFHWYVRAMGRLRPGADEAQLTAALAVVWAREAAEFMGSPQLRLEAGRGGETEDRRVYRWPVLLLSGVVAAVLLVACANLAGLSLARGAARQHELAIRAALGSGRWRLIRQSLIESLLLALAGGVLGVVLALWLQQGIARLLAGSRGELRYDFSLDGRVLGFALLIVLVTALLAGVLPALRAGRIDPLDGLKSRGVLGLARLRSGRILVVAQIAVSLVLLTGAALFVHSLAKLAQINAGFSTDKLLLFQVNVAGAAAGAQPTQYYDRVQRALAALPGVRSASLIEFPLLSGGSGSGGFDSFSGRARTGQQSINTRRLTVGETFFATVGVPILRGRAFAAEDSESAPKVAVVNEAFVRKYLADEDPVGLSFRMWDAEWRIVGVCHDIKYNTLKGDVPPTTYFPFRQRLYSRFKLTHLRTPYFAVRTVLPPLTLLPAVRRAVLAIDPNVALTEATTQEEVRARSIGPERLFALLCGGLAMVALLLACVGLYGLMAYNVTRRTTEFGLRVALGATTRAIVRPILGEALALAGLGVALGLPLTLALIRVLGNRLYEISTGDAWALVPATGLLAVVALLATWLPARRAAQADPMTALRAE